MEENTGCLVTEGRVQIRVGEKINRILTYRDTWERNFEHLTVIRG